MRLAVYIGNWDIIQKMMFCAVRSAAIAGLCIPEQKLFQNMRKIPMILVKSPKYLCQQIFVTCFEQEKWCLRFSNYIFVQETAKRT